MDAVTVISKYEEAILNHDLRKDNLLSFVSSIDYALYGDAIIRLLDYYARRESVTKALHSDLSYYRNELDSAAFRYTDAFDMLTMLLDEIRNEQDITRIMDLRSKAAAFEFRVADRKQAFLDIFGFYCDALKKFDEFDLGSYDHLPEPRYGCVDFMLSDAVHTLLMQLQVDIPDFVKFENN